MAIPELIHDNKFVIHDVPADTLGMNFGRQIYYKIFNDSYRRSLKINELHYRT